MDKKLIQLLIKEYEALRDKGRPVISTVKIIEDLNRILNSDIQDYKQSQYYGRPK